MQSLAGTPPLTVHMAVPVLISPSLPQLCTSSSRGLPSLSSEPPLQPFPTLGHIHHEQLYSEPGEGI